MSRHKFGGMVADWAFSFNSDGSVSQAGGAVLTFWDSLSGGTQYTAAPLPGGVDDGTGLLDGTGTPVSAVTCDTNGEIPDALQGPDGVYRMAADASGAGTGPRRWLYANDIGTDLATLLADVASLPAQAQAPEYVYYDSTLAAYPARPATSAVVWWVGPVQPVVGAPGATGSDVWLNTTGATPPGGVLSVTATDASVVVGGTTAAPTIAAATLDQIAAIHPPVADWSNNGARITSVAAGVAGTDAATVGQLSASAGLLVPTPVKTAAYTAAAGDFVLVSTASANVTVTLPAAPADQTRVAVKMVAQGGANTVTVTAGGSGRFNVAGGVTSMVLLRVFQTITMQYQASAGLWLITGADVALALDTTAADIQPDGAQAAGATSKAADAGHVHPAGTVLPSDNALLAANFPQNQAVGTQIIQGPGNLYLFKIWIRQPFRASSLYTHVFAAGAGASSGSFFGLWNQAGTLLTGSADIGASFTSTGPKPVALTTPQDLTVSMGWVWAGFVFNLATTQPTLRCSQGGASGAVVAMNFNLPTAALACAINGTAVTSLGNITPASNSSGGNACLYFVGVT